MNIENKITELLQPIPKAAVNGAKPVPKLQASTFVKFSHDTSYDVEKMNVLIADEINRIPPKSRWRSLGKSYQWELICKYLEDQEQYETVLIPIIKEKLKKALQNDIDVKVMFDHVNSKIQKICD